MNMIKSETIENYGYRFFEVLGFKEFGKSDRNGPFANRMLFIADYNDLIIIVNKNGIEIIYKKDRCTSEMSCQTDSIDESIKILASIKEFDMTTIKKAFDKK